ncbi:TPA: hypothetical protein ACG0MY_003678 [Serratia marcescens]|uniref:hypothetical protein n=1 Tax=Serratia nevei TaxID=2703794 RepID=UPI00313AA50E
MKLLSLFSEHTAPESFSRILTPTQARHELERHYLFGGAAGISISSRYSITRNTQSGIGVTGYREDAAVVTIGPRGGRKDPSYQSFKDEAALMDWLLKKWGVLK